ncbi:hypothetical protein [Vibrio vulnificus]|uniref:hypothetical protein n=1 Tax=Vibrio vulnificus TaxID=672 RepID=UPI001EEA2D73|nr:hypothetical protein [Vibrio vulnificus]MCG6288862.1 hypothetical protein [Vibrio vulnificus]
MEACVSLTMVSLALAGLPAMSMVLSMKWSLGLPQGCLNLSLIDQVPPLTVVGKT